MARAGVIVAILLIALGACASGCGPQCESGGDGVNYVGIQASTYDQTCKVDSDCIEIPVGNTCNASTFVCGAKGAINVGAKAQYTADVDKTPAAGAQCLESQPSPLPPCCVAGQCQAECLSPAESEDAGDANSDACAPSGCIGSCLNLNAHNVSTVVNGCTVWQCCVPEEADGNAMDGEEADTDATIARPAACVAAGGTCVIGPQSNCASGNIGPQNCNPDRDPGGAICCLPGDASAE